MGCFSSDDYWRLEILEVQGSHYLCSKNKGTDQLCHYYMQHILESITRKPVYQVRHKPEGSITETSHMLRNYAV